MSRKPIVEMRGIRKSFGAVQALCGIDLTLYQNEVLGLVGDNAAGKSTLMKILTGAYRPDAGEIIIDGEPVRFQNPVDSRRLGIEMVYQDLALANNLDVASNIFLGRERVRFKVGSFQVLDKRQMEREARGLLDRFKIDIHSVRAKVENLSGGQRQAIAIGRASAFNPRIMIMDEPTAALSMAASDQVLELIQQLKASGVSIILISHRLEDIFRVAGRVIVLSHGSKVGELPIGDDPHEFREQVMDYMMGLRNPRASQVDSYLFMLQPQIVSTWLCPGPC